MTSTRQGSRELNRKCTDANLAWPTSSTKFNIEIRHWNDSTRKISRANLHCFPHTNSQHMEAVFESNRIQQQRKYNKHLMRYTLA